MYYNVQKIFLLKCSSNYLLLLTPWFRVLLEKLIGLQLVKRFPAQEIKIMPY